MGFPPVRIVATYPIRTSRSWSLALSRAFSFIALIRSLPKISTSLTMLLNSKRISFRVLMPDIDLKIKLGGTLELESKVRKLVM